MLEDVQQFILQNIIFTGDLPRRTTQPATVHEAPGGEIRARITVPATMEIAGTVSRAWQRALQQHLLAQAEAAAPMSVILPSVMCGLNMCESERYQVDMDAAPPQNTYVYSLFLRQTELFSVRFIRQRTETRGPDGKLRHELVVQCGAPQAQGYALSAQHVVDLPDVCWVNALSISDEDLDVFLAWRERQLADIEQWITGTLLPLELAA